MVSTVVFHARVRGSFPGLGSFNETIKFLPHPLLKLSIVESLRDREVAWSVSDLQGFNFESWVWRAVSSYTSHHFQEVILAQFSLCVWPKARFISFHFHRLDGRIADRLADGLEVSSMAAQFDHNDDPSDPQFRLNDPNRFAVWLVGFPIGPQFGSTVRSPMGQ